jgi:hypothetical protein
MNLTKTSVLMMIAAIAISFVEPARSATISQWSFPVAATPPDNSPAPDFGPGVASVLGMTNAAFVFSSGNTITGTGTFIPTTVITTGSQAAADILATAGDPSGDANAWRIRGASTGTGTPSGNGWNLAAPQFSQGAQFSVDTTGFTNINFSADWFTTNQGVKNMQPQYTTDGVTWNAIGPLLTATQNGWAMINFPLPAGAANDPNFGVRLVSAYTPSLSPLNYGSADGAQSGVYNNNSGNWRFTAVNVTGTPVPEPSSMLIAACGLVGLMFCGWRRRRTA